MKVKLLIIILLAAASIQLAQTYPEVTIKDIQFLTSDTLAVPPHDYASPLNGDTVTVVGVMMNPPYEGTNPDSIRTLHAGTSAAFLQDTSMTEWSGILMRFPNSTPIFDVLDSGTVVKATGVVGEFFTTTQFNLIDFQASDIIGIMKRPEPVVLTLDSLVETGTSNPKYIGEKWEGAYVEIRNVTTAEPGVIGFNSFTIFDAAGSSIVVGNSADYYRRTPAPLPGTKIDMIRGYIENRTNISPHWFMINPVFPEDIKFGDIIPPNILNVDRDIPVVGPGENVVVSALMVDADGTVDTAKLFYSVNEGDFQEVLMTATVGDTVFSGTIPAQTDSVLVSYYVEAIDNNGASSTNPTNIATSRYFYHVLNRPLTINDVQYSPFGSGFSGYDSYEVTVRGVVTADTTDIQGDGNQTGAQVIIQNGTGPWSGIQIFGTEVLGLSRGDDVTVTGIVNESFGYTRIEGLDDPSKIVLNGTAPIPAATDVGTDMVAFSSSGTLPAESFEGVLSKYSGITVIDENADGDPGPDEGTGGNRNFGEMLVADASNVQTRVELQDGTHNYHNFWNISLENEPIRIFTNDTFDSITGILFYSFGNFKLVPRKNDDFQGHVTDVEEENIVVDEYSLSQNYPNPFNPSTVIEYNLKQSGLVNLNVYNILGQKILTLVNELQEKGNHKKIFNASALPSGIYFYRLESGNFNSTKKMMLLK